MVYFNEQDAYMRVGYNNAQKEYRVVDVKYNSVTGEENGYHYFIMKGDNPSFITKKSEGEEYIPDHLLWVWDKDKKSELPYITDDPDFNEKSLLLVDYYKAVEAKDLNDQYLRQFFGSKEKQFEQLRKMYTSVTNNNNNNNNNTNNNNNNNNNNTNTNAGGKPKLHLLLAVNSEIPDIGQSCATDQRTMEREFRDIAKALNINMEKYEVNGEKFTKQNLEKTLNAFKPAPNDIVVFYYSGHGFRWSDQTDKYPQLDFRYSSYTRLDENTTVALSDVYNTLNKKGARLNLILSDCCNSDVGRNQMTSTNFMGARAFQGAEVQKLRDLFLNNKGNVMITGSSPGEYSWCNASGGFMTLSFVQALKEEIGYMSNEAPSWYDIVTNTTKSTQYKAKSCSDCQPQNPVNFTKVGKL